MLIRDVTPVIQMSLTPVVMISGVGLLLLSMINRYSRVIDNARRLLERARHAGEADRPCVLSQLRIVYARCHSLRVAIFLACLSVLIMALLIATLFLASLLHLELAAVLVILFLSSLFSLSASLIGFILDINGSLQALAIEVAHETNLLRADAPLLSSPACPPSPSEPILP